MNSDTLIHRYLLGEATEAEVKELDALLAEDPQLRRRFIFEAGNDAALREYALERESAPESSESKAFIRGHRPHAWIAAAAAIVLLTAVVWSQVSGSGVIATLASVEDASWQSSLPTELGSELTRGQLKLSSGIATIRFKSGAEVTIEAPAKLMLKSSMRAKLIAGAAVVNVPEQAVGFVLETPQGHVVDHGTQFAVSISKDRQQSDFEVIEGEISVHSSSGEKVRLRDQQTASISGQALTSSDGHQLEQPLEEVPEVLRIGTNGRVGSAIFNNRRKFLHPEMMFVTRSNNGIWVRRGFFAFDLSGADLERFESARLRLNLVPSGGGFATRLPKINQFAIYGLTNDAKSAWPIEATWEQSPGPEDGVLLGRFEIPRSQQRGTVGIEGEELLAFLKERRGEAVTLILVRETGTVAGEGKALIHAFANDSHPEASGPILEFSHDTNGKK